MRKGLGVFLANALLITLVNLVNHEVGVWGISLMLGGLIMMAPLWAEMRRSLAIVVLIGATLLDTGAWEFGSLGFELGVIVVGYLLLEQVWHHYAWTRERPRYLLLTANSLYWIIKGGYYGVSQFKADYGVAMLLGMALSNLIIYIGANWYRELLESILWLTGGIKDISKNLVAKEV